jgi:hypothetical protein
VEAGGQGGTACFQQGAAEGGEEFPRSGDTRFYHQDGPPFSGQGRQETALPFRQGKEFYPVSRRYFPKKLVKKIHRRNQPRRFAVNPFPQGSPDGFDAPGRIRPGQGVEKF